MASEQLSVDSRWQSLDGGYGAEHHEDESSRAVYLDGGSANAWVPTTQIADYSANPAALTLRALSETQYESMESMGG